MALNHSNFNKIVIYTLWPYNVTVAERMDHSHWLQHLGVNWHFLLILDIYFIKNIKRGVKKRSKIEFCHQSKITMNNNLDHCVLSVSGLNRHVHIWLTCCKSLENPFKRCRWVSLTSMTDLVDTYIRDQPAQLCTCLSDSDLGGVYTINGLTVPERFPSSYFTSPY